MKDIIRAGYEQEYNSRGKLRPDRSENGEQASNLTGGTGGNSTELYGDRPARGITRVKEDPRETDCK